MASKTSSTIVTTTFAGAYAAAILAILSTIHRVTWPATKYRDDPVGFFRDILGIDPWDRQLEVLEAVRDHDRVAISGGRKVSKSCNIAGLALWWYCTRDDAQVVLTSAGARQINKIIWRELRMMFARSGHCVACRLENERRAEKRDKPQITRPCPHSQVIDGNLHELAQSGLKSGFREVSGFSASDPVAAQGISGKNLLYLTDESTGISDLIFDAIVGNMAGGGKLAMWSNPTTNDGFFFAAFNKDSSFKTITISSRESPNVKAGKTIIRGLATAEYIANAERDYGKDSPFVTIHIDGKFATKEEGKVVNLHLISQSQKAWEEASQDSEYRDEGRLFIGVDPAGDSGLGDDSTFAVRRGKRIISIDADIGLTAEAHLVKTLSLISIHRRPREEKPVVVLDREGKIGWDVYCAFLRWIEKNPDSIILIPFRGSDAPRQQDIYGLQRDESWADFATWIRDGGMIPPDAKLAKDLHAPSWYFGNKGKQRVTPKEDLRKILGRSPDRGDAVVLSCWEATPYALGIVEEPTPQQGPSTEDIQAQDPYAWERLMDPYGGLRAFER